MTKFKVYRVSGTGQVQVGITEALDWMHLFSLYQYNGSPIFKVEVFSGPEPIAL